MKPLIKWPGGKRRELQPIRAAMPQRPDLYIEPFFGGGAVFFDQQPPHAHLNDINSQLITFYRLVQSRDDAFRDALDRLADDWNRLRDFVDALLEHYLHLTGAVSRAQMTLDEAESRLLECLHERLTVWQGQPMQFLGWQVLRPALEKSMVSKLRRTRHLEQRHEMIFDADKNHEHLETAVRAAYYTAMRDDFRAQSDAEDIAAFYFIREFCYGSMFRYNQNGDFNIPYGGIAYNRKDFRQKLAHLLSDTTQNALREATFHNLDFESFFATIAPDITPNAFVFLDPPYDTEFSDYQKAAFGESEQRRLAALFTGLACKAMLVIKDTPLIRELYGDDRFHTTPFQKTYTYNVLGRNERHVQHLLIRNYE